MLFLLLVAFQLAVYSISTFLWIHSSVLSYHTTKYTIHPTVIFYDKGVKSYHYILQINSAQVKEFSIKHLLSWDMMNFIIDCSTSLLLLRSFDRYRASCLYSAHTKNIQTGSVFLHIFHMFFTCWGLHKIYISETFWEQNFLYENTCIWIYISPAFVYMGAIKYC